MLSSPPSTFCSSWLAADSYVDPFPSITFLAWPTSLTVRDSERVVLNTWASPKDHEI